MRLSTVLTSTGARYQVIVVVVVASVVKVEFRLKCDVRLAVLSSFDKTQGSRLNFPTSRFCCVLIISGGSVSTGSNAWAFDLTLIPNLVFSCQIQRF